LLLNTKDNLHLGSEELHNDNLKTCHGFPAIERTEQPHDEEMEEVERKNYFSAPRFIVLKQSVHHVVLLLPGPNFQIRITYQHLAFLGKSVSY